MPIVESDADRVISDRLDRLHEDILFPRHGDALVGAVALNFRAWTEDAQKLSLIIETAAIIKANG